MSFNSYLAIRLTPAFASETNWPGQFQKVCGLLGFKTDYPGVKPFVRAVRIWQENQTTLKADGILGPRTWKLMEPALRDFVGEMPKGPLPDWAHAVVVDMAFRHAGNAARMARQVLERQAQFPVHQAPACQSPKSAEDQMFKEMAVIAVGQRKQPYHAYEISVTYAIHASKLSEKSIQTKSDLTPWASFVGTLQVGQVWPGVKGGKRIIVALTSSFDSQAQGMSCEIVFVTDSGRFYAQSLRGWAHDYSTALVDNVNRKLAPLKVMLEVEAAFLLGVMSAVSLVAGAYVLAASVLAWWGDPKNRETMLLVMVGFRVVKAASDRLKKLAPTLHAKVSDAVLKSVLHEITDKVLRDPKLLAQLAGAIIWTLGAAFITRTFGRALDGIWLVLSYVAKILMTAGVVATKVAGTAIVAAPGAALNAAKKVPAVVADVAAQEFAKALAVIGIVISVYEATTILFEIKQNPQLLKQELDKLHKGLTELLAAVARIKA